MIPALLAMLGPKLLAGLGSQAASGGLLGMSQLMGSAGGKELQALAPTLSASMMQQAPQQAPQGGLLNLQSSGSAIPPVPESALPSIPQAAKLGGRYQRQFKGLLS